MRPSRICTLIGITIAVVMPLVTVPAAWASHCDGIDQWQRIPGTNDIARNPSPPFGDGNQIRNPLRTACDNTSDAVHAAAQTARDAAQRIVNTVFGAISTAITDANQLGQWLSDANNAAGKAVSDFASCPSPDAQQLYDNIKNQRASAQRVRGQADQQDRNAQSALNTCKSQVDSQFSTLCDGAYTGPHGTFQTVSASAQGVMNADDAALNALKALKCVAGCGKHAEIVVPTVSVGPAERVKVPPLQFDVCSHWTGGRFSAHLEAEASGDVAAKGGGRVSAREARGRFRGGAGVEAHLSGGVEADLPKCDQTETITIPPPGYCVWQIDILLPELKKLKIVPPEVTPPQVRVQVPRKTVRYISGVKKAQCAQEAKVCTGVTVGAHVGLGDDPTSLAQCTQWADAGCANPPFGLEPDYSVISVPDPADATVTWSGGRVNPGSVKVDLSKGEFKVACRPSEFSFWRPGPVHMGKRHVQTPLCIAPSFGDVVANP